MYVLKTKDKNHSIQTITKVITKLYKEQTVSLMLNKLF